MKKFFEEFKEFAIGGNLVDLAIGVIIGGAFSAVVGSLVSDIFVPFLGLIFGSQDGLASMQYKGIMYGNFISSVITFLLTALCLFTVIKTMNAAKRRMIAEKPAEEAGPTEMEQVIALLKDIKNK